MKTRTAYFSGIAACAAIALSGMSCKGSSDSPVAPRTGLSSIFERTMPSLDGATDWINSPPLESDALHGKVVLIDFWTYTCINWMRTAPYVRLWAEKYKDAGLVVIGVHSPEFEFEQDPERVRRFTAAMDLTYPVAVDSRQAIWRAFHNQYWPALYLVDAQGRIRHRQFGEADYDKAEIVLRALLKEAGAHDFNTTIAPVVGQGPEAAADWANLKSPETYVGYSRTERFASPGGIAPSERHLYTPPPRLRNNQWALDGDWTITQGSARSNTGSARVLYRFHARDVHVVMGSPNGPVRIRVLIDGKPPGASHGTDTDADGAGIVSEYRMYQLIRQPAPIEDREIEITFFDRDIELFAFTFG